MARAGRLSGKVEAIRMQLKAVAEAAGIDPNVYALESVPAGEADGGAEVPIDQHLRKLSQRLNRLTPVVGDLEAAAVIQRVEQRTVRPDVPFVRWISSSLGCAPTRSPGGEHSMQDGLSRALQNTDHCRCRWNRHRLRVHSGYGNLVEITHRRGLAALRTQQEPRCSR